MRVDIIRVDDCQFERLCSWLAGIIVVSEYGAKKEQ